MKKSFITTILVLALYGFAFAQNKNQVYTIPLSSPGETGTLVVNLHRGSVNVTGYSGEEVVVTVIPMLDEKESDEATRKGLRRIPNTATQFKIEEESNVVTLSGSHNKRTNFEVKVPKEFDLKIKTHHDGYIGIENVIGEIEADGHHDDIQIKNVGGSVVADTHHGEITVSFISIDAAKPMAFSTYHGDIDITFPKGVSASTKIKSSRGEIYTDFDLELKVETTKIDSKPVVAGSESGTKIEIGGWMNGNLGSGGQEYLFNTYHGDIILRMK